ncbi:uncharacterized protein METZ01_LOCUS229034, partial [marine metagenome]
MFGILKQILISCYNRFLQRSLSLVERG